MSGNPYQANAEGTDPGGHAAGQAGPQAPGGEPLRQTRHKARGSQGFRTNIILAGLFVAGAATVYVLSLRGGPAKASAEQKAVESKVEAMMAKLATTATKQGPSTPGEATQELVRKFYEQITERQMPLGALRKNPFYFVYPQVRPTEGDPEAGEIAPPEAGSQPDRMTEEKVLGELRGLHLQSVMTGTSSNSRTAIISDNLLTVGQRIKCFVVKKIAPDSVILEWEGREYILNM